MVHRTWIELDRGALIANSRELRKLLGPQVLMLAVVKANAYGHGLVPVGRALETEVDWFGVDSVDEGIALRDANVRKPVLVLGFTPYERSAEVIRYDLRQVVYDLEAIGALDDASHRLGMRALVHMKIETGMARQGIPAEELARFLSVLPRFSGVSVEGATTHLANVDDEDPTFTELQLTRFHTALEVFRKFEMPPKIRHASSSAAAMIAPDAHFDLVRFGIALYGLWPAAHIPGILALSGKVLELTPVLAWRTRIAQVKEIPQGSPVGYGLTERVNRDARIAVLPVGYADGYDRRLSSRGQVIIAGKRAKVLGVVMMNIIVVDVTDIPGAKPGVVATLIGRDGKDEISAFDIAEQIGTIHYEVLARLNPLLPRVAV